MDPHAPPDTSNDARSESSPPRRGRRWLRIGGVVLLGIIVLLVIARLCMPSAVTWYVNRTLQQSPLYRGQIDGVQIALWRGAYAIENIRLQKQVGSVPEPLFQVDRLDLAIEWGALMHGHVVGKVRMDRPELNFVDAPPEENQGEGDDAGDQIGADGPWLEMLADLFPFEINRVDVVDGSVHFRTSKGAERVDVYLSDLQASVNNLTNVRNETKSLITTVRAEALAMDQAKFECLMSLDPFSYRPTFELRARLLNLDVTKINSLTRTYGSFDFERGWFDLVIDLESTEGRLDGYVKPLFRDLTIISGQDVKEDDVLRVFWEALVGTGEFILRNQQRTQFGTFIPIEGDASQPAPDILSTIGNVLRNAFIRAYLPRLENRGEAGEAGLRFGKASPIDPATDQDFAASDATSDGGLSQQESNR